MIDRRSQLSVTGQAKLLGIGRGSVYYCPRPVSKLDLKLMQRIDRLHLELPFAWSRMLQGPLKHEGFEVGRLHVATLMKCMGIEAFTGGRIPRNRRLATRSTPICFAAG